MEETDIGGGRSSPCHNSELENFHSAASKTYACLRQKGASDTFRRASILGQSIIMDSFVFGFFVVFRLSMTIVCQSLLVHVGKMVTPVFFRVARHLLVVSCPVCLITV